MIIGFFRKEKTFSDTEKKHKYAVVICARNEEKVIGNLLDSIAAQDYPQEQLHVFVIADNCNDGTAAIARERAPPYTNGTTPKKHAKVTRSNSGLHKSKQSSASNRLRGICFSTPTTCCAPTISRR